MFGGVADVAGQDVNLILPDFAGAFPTFSGGGLPMAMPQVSQAPMDFRTLMDLAQISSARSGGGAPTGPGRGF